MKKFIAGLYDIVFSPSNMEIEANRAIYNLESKKLDFES